MPIKVPKGNVALRLSSSVLWLGVAIISFVQLDFEPAVLMSLCGFPPLDIVLRVLLPDDSFNKWARETLCKHVHVQGVIEVYSSVMSQSFETCDILINFAFLHLPLFHFILGFFAFYEVSECIKEVAHHDFLGGMAHELLQVLFYGIEPIILHFGPPVHL